MTCTKRWRKLGSKDPEGRPTGVRLIAHGSQDQIYWWDADAQTLIELGAQEYSDEAFLKLVPDVGIDKAVLIEDVAKTFLLLPRTAGKYVTDALRPRNHRTGKGFKRFTLLTVTERPRKEVYPEQPPNRPVVWLKKTVMQSGNEGF